MRYIPTTLELHRHMTKVLVPKQQKEGVDMIINAKDTYHTVTARREMTVFVKGQNIKEGAVELVVSIFEVDVEKIESVEGNTGGPIDANKAYERARKGCRLR